MTYRTGWDRLDSLRGDLDRLFDDLVGRTPARQTQVGSETEPQSVPVNIFETENELMVVAAMPGIEAENVDIRIDDNYLTIRAEKRGPGQERHKYYRREWSYGPYERTIELPMEVDIDKANATYGNGVVTVALPKSTARRSRQITINLEQSRSERGQHVGHSGVAEAGTGRGTGPKGDRKT